MKKYLILQAKKSMSLFLAVLMLLSCWVWVAPQEAKVEAAQITPSNVYKVKVGYNITVRDATGGHLKYKTVSNHGWGTENGEVAHISSMPSDLKTKGQHVIEFETTDFPTNIKLGMTNGKNGTVNDGRTDVEYIQINGVTVYHGGEGFTGSTETNIYPTYNDGGNFGTTGITTDSGTCNGKFTWPKPMIAGFVDNDATTKTPEISIKLNKVGEANVEGSTKFDITKYQCYDQYGVTISDAAAYYSAGKIANITSTTTYVADSNNSDDPSEFATDIRAKGDTLDSIVVSPDLQINNPQGSSGTDTFYLVRKYVVENVPESTIVSKVSAKVTVTYPKYAVNFNSGLSQAKIPYNGEGSPATGTYSPSAYNGGTIAVPDNKATNAPGYTFLGYWSKQQPASGNASYNAAANVFAYPCTSEDYDSYTKMSGATVENGIVTVTEGDETKRYYDAGVAMDPSTVKTIDVSENYANFTENWYGWWIAKDLSVKFYDVDGTFLGEHLVKAGQKYDAITWPTSKYVNTGYTSGAFKFNVDANIWVDTDGTQINKTSTTGTFDKDIMILTPKTTRGDFDNSYTVKFVHPNNGSSMATGHTGDYTYRQNIESNAEYAYGNLPAVPGKIANDLQYSYTLIGWSDVKPTTGENFHVVLEDADFDANGTAIVANKDWIVRNDAEYYAIYRRATKTYVVQFNYVDATGADVNRQIKVKYGADLVAPTEYVPYTYVTQGFGYTFTEWSTAGHDAFAYDATVKFTSDNFSIKAGALEGTANLSPVIVEAEYGAPVATDYTVKFDYIDENGEEDSHSVLVKHEKFILPTTVDSLTSAEKWENEDKLYTYADKWEITEGSATVGIGGEEKTVGAVLDTADLITLTPISNLTFKAVYANPIPYFTVKYIDGDKTFTDRVLQDSNVPEWTNKVTNDNGTPDDATDDFEEDKIYVPADYEGEGGTYVFQGWFDAATGGKKYTTADKVTSNLTLYSQFKFVPDTFTITFMNHDGSVQLAAGKYEKGQNIEALVVTATKAAQGRAEDDVYKYVFLGWDKAVPTFCEGYDVTYKALYKPVYKYYDVKWYNSKLVDGNWAADKSTSVVEGETVETNLLATTKHTYDSKLYTPSTAGLTCLETAPDGQKYVFAGWYYNDAEGNAVKYERGMTITADMEFYATYTLTAKVHTVTTVVKGETAKYEVADGNKAVIPDPQAGYVDADKHDAFAGWYTDEAYTTAFDADTVIKADTKVYAKFEESGHEFSMREIVKASTYYEKGSEEVWCACDKAKTKYSVDLEMLQDTKAPTGTIYLGGQSWSSDGAPAYETDNQPISIYANDNTDVIITAYDEGIGVKVIRAFVFSADTVLTAQNYGAAQSLAIDVYKDETQAPTNNANFAIKVKDLKVADLDENGNPQYDENNNVKFKSLESGKSYIVYYYVNDKATTDNGAPATGNQLNRLVRTAKFIYDDTAPVFTVEGESNDAAVPTYCGTATVTGVEADAVLKVNGEVVNATDGKYVINYAEGIDNVIITATDKAGNTFSKKIKVADHSYLTTEQAASCGVAGYKKVECIVCGDVKSNETYAALDHIWSGREVIPADCVNNGIVVVTCEICGDKVETEFEEDGVTPVIPALGHDYAKDAEGNIIYTTVTASTCKTAGLGEAICTVCGEGKITTALELDPANHEKITVDEKAADCINDGHYIEKCICGVTIKSETYPATGHGTIDDGTAVWYVTKEPTCYEKGSQELRCTICSNAITENGVAITEEIEATGKHVKTVTNPNTYKEDGFVYYHCATEGCDFEYEPKEYVAEVTEEYTVTFKAEDGTVLDEFTVVEGSSIQKDAVVAPEKANSEDGKYKYTFAGWTDGEKTYKLPLTPEKDLELTATYKETKIKYTHIFSVPTVWTQTTAAEDTTEVYKTLVGTIGDERVPSGTPVFKATGDDANYTYKFEGWARKTDATQTIVTDFTVKGDAQFIAVFSREAITYKVIYYNGTDLVWNTTVNSGESVTFGGTAPTKAYDDDNHYAFSGKWYTDETLRTEYKGEVITAETRLYAGFTATAHTYDKSEGKGTETQKADCILPELTTYACECGHEIVEQTANALGHAWGEFEFDAESGQMISTCSRCGEKDACDASFSVKFVNHDGKILAAENVQANGEVSYDFTKYGTPERKADAENTYEFAGWEDADGNKYLKDYTFTEVKADATYTAYYTATVRKYNVTYVDANNKTLQTAEIAYGGTVPAFKGTAPTKKYDDTNHYIFTGWSVAAGSTVKGDVLIRPVFEAIEHDFDKEEIKDATCTTPGGKHKICTACGYSYASTETVPVVPHDWKEVGRDEPDNNNGIDGTIYYECKNCDATKEDKIPAESTHIKLTVVDEHGAPIVGAKVVLYQGEQPVAEAITNENGVAEFVKAKGEYTYSVFIDGEEVISQEKAKEGESSTPAIKTEEECGCSCHRQNFWGIIFRLLQKFIKLFTGKISCCSCPDPAYK